jgi:hypothetical protein
LKNLLAVTDKEVDWVNEVWDILLEWLTDRDKDRRSRSAQFLSNLALSDPEKRILNDFSKLWTVTYDPKFITARHTLQNIWKVGLSGPEQSMLQHGQININRTEVELTRNYSEGDLNSLKRLSPL